MKAGAKARASSSILRPLGTRHQHDDGDHFSSSNVSGRSSPNSTNHGFHARAATSKLSPSKSSYPPSRASRDDIETCDHNVSSPLPTNLTPPLEQASPNRDHFNPVYLSSASQSPPPAKVGNGDETGANAAQMPMRRNSLGTAENARSSSVYWDQEAGRFVSAATRSNVGLPYQVSETELMYTGQSIFFGGPLVNEQLNRGTRSLGSVPGGAERGPASSYYQQGRSQRGGQLPVFVPSDSQQNHFPSRFH